MDFDQFNDFICSQIGIPATVKYGNIGTDYLIVLGFQDGKFIELGSLIYIIWRKTLYTEQDLIDFGKECEDYRLGLQRNPPVWCYKTIGPTESKLTFYEFPK